ncbi:serine phosphatase RsbU (regulator of sigma subunit) [Streptosporangium becharense]|uniref:Serine phosphatase RsbU (Regulator of sigma subunit) n=1 Tax=Streptosporangium becharense TaxID=1816182 RepID=A0A7W9IIG1_9ACTN|nr:SpoIIE family protein phosphatase [Streptosporangium becharense]MBB2913471.1 serine phosphatase RsbU (regulator of sigma subunit) [Streptosporangium becharense]MBB5821161.1 serine phosphatase RsbU (regulator of sigma subunit) [Streptosporangium becharense]
MTAPPNETLTLLLIEDDAGDAFLVEELLGETENPPKIIWVRSLAESLERLTEDVHCVLVDLSLPDATGLEALEQVLSAAPHAAVLVLTGLNDTHVGVEAVAAGAQDFLVKQDVEARLLARAIRYAIERKRADLAQRKLVEVELLTKENSRLERGLLPVPLLTTDSLEHHARYLPGRRRALLAGDFWDTVQSPDGAVHVVVGDVCGHGPDEAALGVSLRIAWRTLVLAGHSGNDLLGTLDAVLRLERKSAEIFTTLCIATIDPALDVARMHVVGHPPPLLIRDGELGVVPGTPSGPPLGIFKGVEWSEIEVPLGDDWSLLLYTDGLIEATVGGGPDLLGTEGLLRIIQEQGGINLDRLIERVTELNRDALSDDLATVLISRRER